MNQHSERPFAYKVQAVLIVGLLLSFLLLMQSASLFLYKLGLLTLIIATLIQIPFGNIPPEADAKKTIRLFARMVLVVIAIFGVGILIAPILVNMGR